MLGTNPRDIGRYKVDWQEDAVRVLWPLHRDEKINDPRTLANCLRAMAHLGDLFRARM